MTTVTNWSTRHSPLHTWHRNPPRPHRSPCSWRWRKTSTGTPQCPATRARRRPMHSWRRGRRWAGTSERQQRRSKSDKGTCRHLYRGQKEKEKEKGSESQTVKKSLNSVSRPIIDEQYMHTYIWYVHDLKIIGVIWAVLLINTSCYQALASVCTCKEFQYFSRCWDWCTQWCPQRQ